MLVQNFSYTIKQLSFFIVESLTFRRCKAVVNHPRVCRKYQSLVKCLFL